MNNRDEIRKLVGGYATGSLTDAERKLLMDAALDDQDLFDEMMREQELKALLDAPGARPRLIGAVTPQKRRSTWLWGALAGVAAAVLITLLVWPGDPDPEPVQLAKVQVANVEQPVPQEPVPPPVVETAPAPAPAPTPPAQRALAPVEIAEERDAAPAREIRADIEAAGLPVATVSPPPPQPPPPQPVRVATPQPAPPAAPKPVAAQQFAAAGTVSGTVSDPSGAALVDVAVTATNQQTGVSFTANSSATGRFTLPDLPPGQYLLGANQLGFRQFQTALAVTPQQERQLDITLEVGQATESVTVADAAVVLRTEAAPAALARVAQSFGITYALNRLSLQLTPLMPGVLQVTAKTAEQTISVFPRNPVVAGTQIVLAVPGAASEVTVAFAASAGVVPASEPQRLTDLAGTISGPPELELRFVIPVRQ